MSAHNPSHGTKVKTDPAGLRSPIQEGAGPVTSDSLAAESTRSGGGFAQNRDSEPLAVKGSNSTFNTTDTSAADVLPPASDAAHRSGPEEELSGLGKGDAAGAEKGSGTSFGGKGEHEQPEHQTRSEGAPISQDVKTSSGQGQEAGTHTTGQHHGHHGGRKHHKSGIDTTHQPEPAPTYVKADILDQPLHPKPKGRNLTEGGIEDDAPNASFTAEIGSQDDPGRLAELKFAAAMAHSARDSGYGPKQKKITNDDQYNILGEEEAP